MFSSLKHELDYLKLLLAVPSNYCVVSHAFVSLSIKWVYGNLASFFSS